MPSRIGTLFALILLAATLRAEDGSQAWLRYAPPLPNSLPAAYQKMPATLIDLDASPESASAQNELLHGIRSMLDRTLRVQTNVPANDNAWILGTSAEIHTAFPEFHTATPGPEGFSLSILTARGRQYWIIAGADPRGLLYGAFHMLSGIARGVSFAAMQGAESPAAPVRWVNQWDNLNGTIERGYGGRSIFFDNDQVRTDLTRAAQYARLLASIGINGCTINNV
ncbi:MAG: alpha-glucuronidase family glycosyl hydrolase, partial [Acidobacteriota bacterium]